jgi:hypothetical protein
MTVNCLDFKMALQSFFFFLRESTAKFQLHEMPLQSYHIYKHATDLRISLILDKSVCLLPHHYLSAAAPSYPHTLLSLQVVEHNAVSPTSHSSGQGVSPRVCTQPYDVCGKDEPHGKVQCTERGHALSMEVEATRE